MHLYQNIRNNFYTKSDIYIKNATVQQTTKKILIDNLDKYYRRLNNSNIYNILNIGVRDSIEPMLLLERFKAQNVDAIDITLDNININEYKNINFHELNFDTDLSVLNKKFQLIFSNMSLQWSSSLDNLFINLYEKLDNNGILAFSTLLSDNFREISNILRVNQMLSFECIASLALKNGFKIIYKKQSFSSLYFDTFRDLICHIRNTGVNTYIGSNNNHYIKKIRENLSKNTSHKLTYHIGIFILQKVTI